MWFKAEEIMQELDELLTYDECEGIIKRGPEEIAHLYVACYLSAVLSHMAAFNHRFVLPCQRYPWRLFLLIKDPPNISSDLRKSESRALLEPSDRNLETNTAKIRHLLRTSLQIAASEGTLPLEADNFL